MTREGKIISLAGAKARVIGGLSGSAEAEPFQNLIWEMASEHSAFSLLVLICLTAVC
jgi:hypothetical protein